MFAAGADGNGRDRPVFTWRGRVLAEAARMLLRDQDVGQFCAGISNKAIPRREAVVQRSMVLRLGETSRRVSGGGEGRGGHAFLKWIKPAVELQFAARHSSSQRKNPGVGTESCASLR